MRMRPLVILARGFRNGRIGNRMCSSSSLVEGDVEEERIRDEIEVRFVFVFISLLRKHENVRSFEQKCTEIEILKEFGNMKLRLITPDCEMYNATERDLPVHWTGTLLFVRSSDNVF